jgi:hypothetical protein
MKTIFVFLNFVRTMARELSDENAYARYLAISGRPHSAAAWQEFSDQRHRRKYQNAKCC